MELFAKSLPQETTDHVPASSKSNEVNQVAPDTVTAAKTLVQQTETSTSVAT